jgi:hypothetical protein
MPGARDRYQRSQKGESSSTVARMREQSRAQRLIANTVIARAIGAPDRYDPSSFAYAVLDECFRLAMLGDPVAQRICAAAAFVGHA